MIFHLDGDLGHLRKVSRQHVLIIFNFEAECFEIKCLSRKFPLYVNREALGFGDLPKSLLSGAIIATSSESFFFMMPPKIKNL